MSKRARGCKPMPAPSSKHGVDRLFARYSQSLSQSQIKATGSISVETKQAVESSRDAAISDQCRENVCIESRDHSPQRTPKKIRTNAGKEGDGYEDQDRIVWEISPPMKRLQKSALPKDELGGEMNTMATTTLARCKSETGTAVGERSSSTAGNLERWLASSPSPPVTSAAPKAGHDIVSETSSEATTRVPSRSPGEDQLNVLDLLRRVEEVTQKEATTSEAHLGMASLSAMDPCPAAGSASPPYSRGIPSHIAQLLEGADMDAFFESPSKDGAAGQKWMAGPGIREKGAGTAGFGSMVDVFDDSEMDQTQGALLPLQSSQIANRPGIGAVRGGQPAAAMDSLAGLGKLQHFIVSEVSERSLQTQRVYTEEKVLSLVSRLGCLPAEVILQDEWYTTPVKIGDTVGVIGEFDSLSRCTVSGRSNFIILHPDVLVSGSRVGSSFMCPRRTVLDERIQSSDSNAAALFGTMLHQLFQAALRSESCSRQFLLQEVERVVSRNIDGIYAVHEEDDSALAHLIEKIPKIQKFVADFRRPQPPKEPNLPFSGIIPPKSVCISEVVDIEESVWSPQYGLKGMIDASVVTRERSAPFSPLSDSVMPFELKTGRATTGQSALEHRAQVMLYTLLLSDRYGTDVDSGIIHYLHNGTTQGIKVVRKELVGIIMRRNEHADSLATASRTQLLPPLIQNSRICRKCHQSDNCLVYHKAVERGSVSTSGLPNQFESQTSHLSDSHASFLAHWIQLVDLEASESEDTRRQIWSMPAGEREVKGGCISRLALDPTDVMSHRKGNHYSPASSRCSYTFHRSEAPVLLSRGFNSKENRNPRNKEAPGPNSGPTLTLEIKPSPLPSLLSLPFAKGDRVVLSTEGGHFAICQGAIESMSATAVTVSFPRPLRLGGDRQVSESERLLREVYRLDKDDVGLSSFATQRANLLRLFVGADVATARRRDLIADLAAPGFKEGGGGWQEADGEELNEDQANAVKKVMAAMDYALIVGTPGSGKTTSIVHIVRALVAMDLTVLLTSYTNSAVDNLLLKLKHQGIDFLRVGRADAVHPELLAQTLCPQGVRFESVSGMEEGIRGARVVGVTCLGVTSHPLFTRRTFDVCVVDEASQMTLPACLGPLRFARRFVLVGDHKQLPPLVKSERARKGGMDRSLFEVLCQAHPQAVVQLSLQYRMCAEIMSISNHLVYGGQLACATPKVQNSAISYAQGGLQRLHSLHPSLQPWLASALSPDCRVLFLNTDATSAAEWRQAENRRNDVEARLAVCVVLSMHLAAVEGSTAVISPYIDQVRSIRQLWGDLEGPRGETEVDTIDRFQGRDKDCVVLSFVCSNLGQPTVGRHLADVRRLNVAVTRAKGKLVMIGSRLTLKSNESTNRLIEFVESKGWVVDLPPSCVAQCDAVIGSLRTENGKEEVAMAGSVAGNDFRRCTRGGSRVGVKVFRGGAKKNIASSLRKL